MAASQVKSHLRYWWLKRLSLAWLVGLLLLGVVWGLWYRYANGVLAQEVARLRSAGHPTGREDLRAVRLDNERNAAVPLREAIAALPNVQVPGASSMMFGSELPYPPKWHAMMATAYPAHAEVYSLVRKARLIGRIDWGALPPGPLVNAIFTPLSGQRQLAIVLGDTALYQHFSGDDAAALDTISDLLFLSDATPEMQFTVPNLVGIGIRALALDRLQTICTDLRIEPHNGTPSPSPTRRAPREQVTSLLDRLLSDQNARQCANAMYSEGVLARDVANTGDARVFRPLYLLGAAQALQCADQLARGATQRSYPLARPYLNRYEPFASRVTGLFYFGNARTIEHSYTTLAFQRAAAISLAISLYRVDHGRFPQTLNELVSAYLKSVPVDPLSADESLFSYMIVAGGKRPILISAGLDGIVQTKDESLIPTQVNYGWNDTRGRPCDDQYIDLSAWKDPNPPQLLQDTSDDHSDQANAPGKDVDPQNSSQQPPTGNGKGDAK